MVGIILLGPMVYDNACMGDGAVFGDAPDFITGEKKDNVSANSGTYFSLRQPMEYLGHCRYPKWTEDWIVHELGVLCDGLFGSGMNNPVAYFLMSILWRMQSGNPARAFGIVYLGGELNARLKTW